MREIADPQACVERLVQLALRGGGPDNITVVIADATDADIVEQAPIVGGAAARDRGNTTVADSSTPAARAAALQAPPRPAQPDGNAYDARAGAASGTRCAPACSCWCCSACSAAACGWATVHPGPVLRRRDRAGQLAIFRGVPGQIAGSTCPASTRPAGPARRPHRRRAGPGQAGHPRRQPADAQRLGSS
jgi:protein phosphatase